MKSVIWLSYDLGVTGDYEGIIHGWIVKVRRNVAPLWPS